MGREKATERCIYCDELIRTDAQFCKHCGFDLGKPKKKKSKLAKLWDKYDNFRTGFAVAAVVAGALWGYFEYL